MKYDSKKISLGIIFLVLAVLCSTAAFYYLENHKTIVRQKLEVDLVEKLVPDRSFQGDSVSADLASESESALFSQPTSSDSLDLQEIAKKAKAIYEEESQRREGFLWVDRDSSQYVITLGSINGLLPEQRLDVYDDEQRLGQVKVQSALDVISYVTPLKEIESLLVKDYYQVTIEK